MMRQRCTPLWATSGHDAKAFFHVSVSVAVSAFTHSKLLWSCVVNWTIEKLRNVFRTETVSKHLNDTLYISDIKATYPETGRKLKVPGELDMSTDALL